MKLSIALAISIIGITVDIVTPVTTATEYQLVQNLTSQEINLRAKQVTVRIDGTGTGTGVIIEQSETTYTVLTNWHVVKQPGTYSIQTIDGRKHTVEYSTVKQLPNLDLAVLQFERKQNYQLAEVGNSNSLIEGQNIYFAGYPGELRKEDNRYYRFFAANLVGILPESTANGYSLIYDGEAFPGMSGGPVFDNRGFLIGIHGETNIHAITGGTSNYAIPINRYRSAIAEIETTPILDKDRSQGDSSNEPQTPSVTVNTRPQQNSRVNREFSSNSSTNTTQNNNSRDNTTQKTPQTTSNPSSENTTIATENNSNQNLTEAEVKPANSSTNTTQNNNNSRNNTTTQETAQTPNNQSSENTTIATETNSNQNTTEAKVKPTNNSTNTTQNNNTTARKTPQTSSNSSSSETTRELSNIVSVPTLTAPSTEGQKPTESAKLPRKPELLSSITGIDYSSLKKLLTNEKWEQADRETQSLIARIIDTAKRQNNRTFITYNAIADYACQDMYVIDSLWQQYTNNRFGLTPQQKVWLNNKQNNGYTPNSWRKFATEIGWKKGDIDSSGGYLLYEQLTFNPQTAPQGHLPWWFATSEEQQKVIKTVLNRCSLEKIIEPAESEEKTNSNPERATDEN